MRSHRILCLTAVLGVVAGGGLGVAAASADGIPTPDEIAYAREYGADVICPSIADHPSPAGVLGVMAYITETDGFTFDNAGDIVDMSVWNYCKALWPVLEATAVVLNGDGASQPEKRPTLDRMI